MTLRQYIERLNEIAESTPEKLDCQVIYSVDDEGNSYKKVNNIPYLLQVQDINQYELEVVGFEGEEGIALEDCNAVIIN